jgi:hypothetical protein
VLHAHTVRRLTEFAMCDKIALENDTDITLSIAPYSKMLKLIYITKVALNYVVVFSSVWVCELELWNIFENLIFFPLALQKSILSLNFN